MFEHLGNVDRLAMLLSVKLYPNLDQLDNHLLEYNPVVHR